MIKIKRCSNTSIKLKLNLPSAASIRLNTFAPHHNNDSSQRKNRLVIHWKSDQLEFEQIKDEVFSSETEKKKLTDQEQQTETDDFLRSVQLFRQACGNVQIIREYKERPTVRVEDLRVATFVQIGSEAIPDMIGRLRDFIRIHPELHLSELLCFVDYTLFNAKPSPIINSQQKVRDFIAFQIMKTTPSLQSKYIAHVHVVENDTHKKNYQTITACVRLAEPKYHPDLILALIQTGYFRITPLWRRWGSNCGHDSAPGLEDNFVFD